MLKYFVGGPDVVPVDSEFSTNENIAGSLTIELEGYPRPNVTFTLDNEVLSTVKVTTGKVYYKHKYEVTLPSLSCKMNRKMLRYEAKGFKSLIGDIFINVLCKYFHVERETINNHCFLLLHFNT